MVVADNHNSVLVTGSSTHDSGTVGVWPAASTWVDLPLPSIDIIPAVETDIIGVLQVGEVAATPVD